MTRRTAKRRRSRRTWAALILGAGAIVLAIYFWRTAEVVQDVPADVQRRSHVQPPPEAPASHGAEEFSAGERQGLEDVLKRRGAGSQR